jgi:hypothetical protein
LNWQDTNRILGEISSVPNFGKSLPAVQTASFPHFRNALDNFYDA